MYIIKNKNIGRRCSSLCKSNDTLVFHETASLLIENILFEHLSLSD